MIYHLLLLLRLYLQFNLPNQLEKIMDSISYIFLHIFQLHEIIEGDYIILMEDSLLAVGLSDLD